MISFQDVTKHYPGSARPAVDSLSLDVPEGEICVFVGPSGCGKTTSMKMVNRLIEPTSGRILIDGKPNTSLDQQQLRRGIGYVIQQVGLFPHRTIGQNVATVPGLVGWNKRRIAERVDELLALVELDPDTYRDRFPAELSGGQQQRVGVARALAADPPVMLMDEPFGAVDPLARERLQDQFLRIQKGVRKTIIFVTHDIDEAIKMGDRIAVLQVGGVLAQYDTPEALLSSPASEFVASFVGADRAIKRLSLLHVGDLDLAPVSPTATPMLRLPAALSAREALSALLAEGVEEALVISESGEPVGVLSLQAIQRLFVHPVPDGRPSRE